MGTNGNVAIRDEHGNGRGLAVGSDGHWLGTQLLFDIQLHKHLCAVEPGEVEHFTPDSFVEWYEQTYHYKNNNVSTLDNAPGAGGWHYELVINGNKIQSLTAFANGYDFNTFMAALQSGKDALQTGVPHALWHTTF